MPKKKVSITDNGIRSGVTSDTKKAICEYIWNGFDAKAIHVNIVYRCNELGFVEYFAIEDDGVGINRELLNETFGRYQDSNKLRSFQWSSQVKGHKGKGRYSFACFATKADWTSVYESEGQLFKHHVSIESEDIVNFNDHSEDQTLSIVHNIPTGTKVEFTNIQFTFDFLNSTEFTDYLKKEYAVFLKLNESMGKSITINGVPLDYKDTIADFDSQTIQFEDKNVAGLVYTFELAFIRWREKMRENYSSYFLDSNQIERYEKTTSFNKKDTGFHHSVYVISSYFDAFVPPVKKKDVNDEKNVNSLCLDFCEYHGDKSEKDDVFKKLMRYITTWITEKQKEYVVEVAGEELWTKFERNGVVTIPQNSYELPLYNDLKQTVKGIYSVQPKVFVNLKKDSAKALVGCIRLLLQTDKREDLLVIMESIVNMSDEERHRLADILQKTELSHITDAITLLEDRMKIVSALKAMVFDTSLNAYEVDDIQKMIGSAFWLFGEQYNIVTEAEPDFQQALDEYLKILQRTVKGKGKSAYSQQKLSHPDKNKEMDVFATRQNRNSQSVENIIIELKRPSVKLGELELSQIKTYMRVIVDAPQFNSTKAMWTFILVGNQLDGSGSIKNEYETNKHWGKKDLVLKVTQNQQEYEIYVRTWSTIFDEFELRHDFLLKRLKFKREKLCAKYQTKEDLHDIVSSTKSIQ